MKKVYLIGSLRNPEIPQFAARLRRNADIDVFDDWYAAGPEADDKWREYEMARGRHYHEAMQGHAARHVHEYDKHHLDTSDGGILLLPAGRSGHLELGYLAGQGKRVWIILHEEYDRWDVMYRFATVVPGPGSAEFWEDIKQWAKADAGNRGDTGLTQRVAPRSMTDGDW